MGARQINEAVAQLQTNFLDFFVHYQVAEESQFARE